MNPSRLIGIVGVIESVDQSKRSSLPINITPLASKMFLIAGFFVAGPINGELQSFDPGNLYKAGCRNIRV